MEMFCIAYLPLVCRSGELILNGIDDGGAQAVGRDASIGLPGRRDSFPANKLDQLHFDFLGIDIKFGDAKAADLAGADGFGFGFAGGRAVLPSCGEHGAEGG